MQTKIGLNRNTAVLAMAIAAIIVSVVTASIVFTAQNARSSRAATLEGRYFDMPQPISIPLRQRYTGMPGRPMATFGMHRGVSTPSHWKQNWSGSMRKPSTILTVTSDQAKTKANDAIREFKVGDAKDTGNAWMVSIKYKDKAVMTVLLGKLNTPTSEDAVKAVQDSIGKGWKAGEPKQLQSLYNVSIIDALGNTVGNIRVDGKSGDIITRALVLRR
jgi:hypothetical protein